VREYTDEISDLPSENTKFVSQLEIGCMRVFMVSLVPQANAAASSHIFSTLFYIIFFQVI
jgi:hypothetical protein